MSMLRNILLWIAAGTALVSCGGTGSSNDQGTSFLALGWYTVDENDEIVPVSNVTTQLAVDAPILAADGLAADGKQYSLLIGLENRLSQQFIRVTRVDCSYDAVGASVPIPDDSVTQSFVLGATDTTDDGFADSDIVRPQAIFMSVPLITTDVFAFINVNRNSFPELPFYMTVTCSAVGVAQSGDVLETNPVSMSVLLVDTAECCTGTGAEGAGGFQNGTGTGGEFDSFGGSGSSTTTTTSADAAVTDTSTDSSSQ